MDQIVGHPISLHAAQTDDGALSRCIQGCIEKTTTVDEYLSFVRECKSILGS